MYIKMNNDKSLVVTVPTTIYQGERNADLITFLVPGNYNNDNLADYKIAMNYVLPSDIGHHEDLECHPDMYKSYLQYGTKINTRFTKEAGVVRVWLVALDDNDSVILKTNEVIITVQESDNAAYYPIPDEVEKLNELEKRLEELASNIVQSDWAQNDEDSFGYIKNKPEIATNDEIIDVLVQEDMIVAVADYDGDILCDENGNILMW